jgi:hypothetical protein
MNDTPNLALPYILAAQAQKHVTHNEAIRALDCLVQLSVESRSLASPPASPAEGSRYLVAADADGDWAGASGKIAAFQDGAWAFYAPREGWIAWVASEKNLVIYSAGIWSILPTGGEGGGVTDHGMLTGLADDDHLQYLTNARGDARYMPIAPASVGINATADATNRLAIASPASLFNHEGQGHQVKVNKQSASNTASFLFQDDFSGRAEIGLTGDDDFHFKVSPDGTAWVDSIRIDRTTGKVSFPAGGVAREVLTANRTYYVSTSGNNSNNGLTAGTAFATIQKAIDVASALDFSTFNVTIQLADGTYTAGGLFSGAWSGAGTLTIQGNVADASKVIVSVTNNHCFACTGLIPSAINLSGMTLLTTTSGMCISHTGSGLINFNSLIFGACAQFHVSAAGPTAKVTATGNYSISGNAQIHILSTQGGMVSTTGRTVTFIANVTFSSRNFSATFGGGIIANGMTFNLGAFAVSGKRYDMSLVSYIYTAGAGASYFPGSVAGTNDPSSVYG